METRERKNSVSKLARTQILENIRTSLRRDGAVDTATANGLEARSQSRAPHAQPLIEGSLVDRFIEKHEALSGTVEQVESWSEIPGAVMRFIATHHLPPRVVISGGFPREVDWPPAIEVEQREARGDDSTSVTGSLAAIAETGTLVMASSKSTPVTLNYLPEFHIVVVPEKSIVAHLEEGLRHPSLKGSHLRAISLITGASRTGDVEQTILLGAHGPRHLHIILIRD